MNNLIQLFKHGWKIIFHHLFSCFQKFIHFIKELIEKLYSHKKEDVVDRCCLRLPDNVRAQPDPLIYSQQWLMQRGMAVTWNNPDFTIIDAITGNTVGSHELKPSRLYRILVTIHNNSVMASLNTSVSIQIHPFGISSGIIIGQTNIPNVNIVGFGSHTVEFKWETPNAIGHICLVAKIFHPDDANPFNNIGQHNTVIIDQMTLEGSGVVNFKIANKFKSAEKIIFRFDTYSLPERVQLPENGKIRNSAAYLRQLQNIHSPSKFMIPPQSLGITIDGLELIGENERYKNWAAIIEGGKEIDCTLQIPLSLMSSLPKATNITVFYDNGLVLGGFTIINNL